MLSQKLNDEMNQQIKYEFFSSHLYLAMAAKLEELDYPGAAHYMKLQAEEERQHAMKFFDFIIEKDGKVDVFGFEDPKFEGSTLVEILESVLKHEKWVTERIYFLMDIAQEEKDYMSINLLNWFVNEQMEEEATADNWIKRAKMIGNDGIGLYQLDKELGERVLSSGENDA